MPPERIHPAVRSSDTRQTKMLTSLTGRGWAFFGPCFHPGWCTWENQLRRLRNRQNLCDWIL